MAIIPLKQTITIIRPQGEDDYGRPLDPITLVYKCRFDEKTELIKRSSSAVSANQSMSQEVVSSARVYLDKLADIRYEDEIFYTNELGIKKKYSVLDIAPKRNISGKPMLTVVFL